MYEGLCTDISIEADRGKVAAGKLFFSWWRVALYAGVFAAVFRGLQLLLRHTCDTWVAFDCPYYWPVSIFEIRSPGAMGFATAGVTLGAFLVCYRVLERKQFRMGLVVAFGCLLIVGSSLVQGVDTGLRAPVAGYAQDNVFIPNSPIGQEYYHDALTITDPFTVFVHYNELQTTFHSHAHTHPPGALLTYYFLTKLLGDPALISLAIMLFAMSLTVVCFYRLVATETSQSTAKYMAFVIAILPAVQVYYLATIDAVITSLLIAALYLFCFSKRSWALPAAALTVTASFLLTFVSLFILPVLGFYELIFRRSLKRFAVVTGTVVAVHLILYLATGYNAWGAFREASHFENPNGPMPLVDTVNYLFTRLEDVAEILFFFGPFLLVMFWRGIKRMAFTPLFTLSVLGMATLLGMYIVGAFRTGETARACAFIYPFLLFPIAKLLDSDSTKNARLQLASLVFLQTVLMQSLGTYHW
ncbi:MAG: hypothetical protein ACJ73D_11860 [Pyrinomonadaceae bacterium]